jgi:cell pole-organizing protein PopZ
LFSQILSKYLTNIPENVIPCVFDLDAAMGSSSLKVNEPSMEDILASIRRIISDDQEPLPPESQESGSSPLKNVLDMAEMHVSPLIGTNPNEPLLGPWSRGDASEDSRPGTVSDRDRETFSVLDEAAPAPIVVPEPLLKAARTAPRPVSAAADKLLSSDASASVSDAFSRLSETVRPAQPQTVEDLMKEMLRPMLKAWLDDNLPPLVERLVRTEIERVTRSRG